MGTVSKPVSRPVPVSKCKDVQEAVTSVVPKQKCFNKPRQVCNQVPKQSCNQVPKQDCKQVPKQECNTEYRKDCTTQYRQVTKYSSEQNATRSPDRRLITDLSKSVAL